MRTCTVTFNTASEPVRVPPGTLLIEAARLAGVKLQQQCKKGSCGRCAVLVVEGTVHRRDGRRRADEMEADLVPACQAETEGDVSIRVMG